MKTPENSFKRALRDRRRQIGLWLGLPDPLSAEIAAGAGFDWLVVDGEHTPHDLVSVLRQLQAIAGYPDTHAVVRVPMGLGHVGKMLIKQVLDIGAQTLLVPMVDTPEQAQQVVHAARYPDASGANGIRGIAGARAARWGRYGDYLEAANREVCVLVQAETRTALQNLEAIAAVDGIDGVFIGPADLAASLGHRGDAGHAEVQAAIHDALQRITRAGKAAGILALDDASARRYLEWGASYVAVGVDSRVLARETARLAQAFRA